MGPTASDTRTTDRGRPFAQLARLLGRATEGTGSVVLVEGAAGMGKTRLLDDLARAAQAQGTEVHRASAGPSDPGRPYGPWLQALGCRATAVDGRRALVADVARRALSDSDPGRVSRFAVQDALVDLVHDLARARPQVVVLDDLQRADPPSLDLLGAIARGARAHAVMVVGAHRPGLGRSARPADAWSGRLTELGGHLVRLGRLGGDEVDAIVEAELGQPAGPRLRARVEGARGNPSVVVTLLRALRAAQAIADDGARVELVADALPPVARRALLAPLVELPAGHIEVVRALAALGRAAEVEELAAMVTVDVAVEGVVGELLADGLVEADGVRVRGGEPLLGEAVLDDLPRPLLASLHRRIGAALAERGAPAAEVVGHLAHDAVPGDARAIRWLRRAAAQHAREDPQRAVDWLQQAAGLAGPGQAGAAVLAELVPPLLRCRQVGASIAAARDGLAMRSSARVQRQLHIGMAEALVASGNCALALEHLEQAAAIPERSGEHRARLLGDMALARMWAFDVARARGDAGTAIQCGAEWADPALEAVGWSVLSRMVSLNGQTGRAVEHAERGLAAAASRTEPMWTSAHHLVLGMATFHNDAYEDAARSFAEGGRLARAAGDIAGQSRCLAIGSLVAFTVGEWDQAVRFAEGGLVLAAENGCRAGASLCDVVCGLIALHRDDPERAGMHLKAGYEDLSPRDAEINGRLYVAWLEALIERHAAREGDGLARFAEYAETVAAAAPALIVPIAPDLVDGLIRANERDRARRVAEQLEGLAASMATATAKAAALSCRGAVEGDVAALLAAVEELRDSRRSLDHARAAERAALACLGREADRSHIAPLLTAAMADYQRLGAVAGQRRTVTLAARVGLRLSTAAGPARSGPARVNLTAAERQVLALVGTGLSNTDIAERLVVSRRTVESHVSRLYAKLGIPNRVLLAAEANRRGLHAAD